MFRKFKQRKLNKLKCVIAGKKKRLEALWEIEKTGKYLFGQGPEIIQLTEKIAYLEKQKELLEKKQL